jgi:hypothetical protein
MSATTDDDFLPDMNTIDAQKKFKTNRNFFDSIDLFIYRENHWWRSLSYTAISMLILPCGLYPISSKSEGMKSSIVFKSERVFIRKSGNGFGLLLTCSFRGST